MSTNGLRHLSGHAPGDCLGKAVFSADWAYRFLLRRIWTTVGPPPRYEQMVLIGLNPSVADHVADDSTVRKAKEFAKRAGCGALAVVNLGAYITHTPAHLSRSPDWTGGEVNDRYLWDTCTAPRVLVVAGWGMNAGPGHLAHAQAVRVARILDAHGVPLYCFGTTADGSPAHLSRHPYASALARWEVTHG